MGWVVVSLLFSALLVWGLQNFLAARFQVSWLFKGFQQSGRAIDSVMLPIAYPFYDIRTFQPFDGALRGRKRDP